MCGCSTTFFFFLSFPRYFCHCWLTLFHSTPCPLCPCWSFMEDGVGFLDLPRFCPFLGPWVYLLLFLASPAHQALFLSRAFVAHLLLFCFPFFSFCACGPISHHFLSGWPTGPYSFLSFFFRPLRPICFCLAFLSLFFNFFFLCLLLGLPAVGLLLPKTEINSH